VDLDKSKWNSRVTDSLSIWLSVQICCYYSMPEIDSLVLIVSLRTLRYIFVLELNRFNTRKFNIDRTRRETVSRKTSLLHWYLIVLDLRKYLNFIFFLPDNNQIFCFLYKSSANVLFIIMISFSTCQSFLSKNIKHETSSWQILKFKSKIFQTASSKKCPKFSKTIRLLSKVNSGKSLYLQLHIIFNGQWRSSN